MDDVVVVLRLVLSAVWVLAAVAKLLDRAGTASAAVALGVPGPVARVVPLGLPVLELGLAALLLPVSSAPWAAGGLVVLTAAFVALVAVNLARGRRPTCSCFGSLDEEPIGPRTLVRNLVLLAGAAVVAAAGHRPGADLLVGGPAVDAVLFLVLVSLAAVAARRSGDRPPARRRPAHVEVGDPAPDFALPSTTGGVVSLEDLRARGLPVVLVFGNLGCPSCLSLLPDVQAWQRELVDLVTVAFVVTGPLEAARSLAEAHGIEQLLVQRQGEAAALFGRLPAPSAVVVGPGGTVQSEPIGGTDGIRELVAEVIGRPPTPYERSVQARSLLGDQPPLQVGTRAPDFRLPTAAGPAITRTDLRSGPLLFVFVARRCAQCTDLLDRLASRPDLGRRAVVVASGGEVPSLPAGLSSPVLVDRLGFLAAVHGATALPGAVVVDDGVVRSPIAVGTEEVLDQLQGIAQVAPIEPEALDAAFVPRPHPRVAVITVDGVTLVGDPATGDFQQLDGPGQLLWSCFDGSDSLGGIAAAVGAELGIEPDAVLGDVLDFARRLGRAGALDGVQPGVTERGAPPADPAD